MSELRVDKITNENADGAPEIQDFLGSQSLKVPVGTTAQRPENPEAGMIRFNTTEETLESYTDNEWEALGKIEPPATQIFTSPGTYDPPATIKQVKVTVLAAGGRGSPGPNAGANRGGGGGGGGAAIKVIPASSLTNPVSVTVGANTPSDGEASSFGAFCSATGGVIGSSSTLPNSTNNTRCLGGIGSGGDVNIGGGGGMQWTPATSGCGGPSILGGGGAGKSGGVTPAAAVPTADQPGHAAQGFGAGGGGAIRTQSSSSGGPGGPGIVIVEEFF